MQEILKPSMRALAAIGVIGVLSGCVQPEAHPSGSASTETITSRAIAPFSYARMFKSYDRFTIYSDPNGNLVKVVLDASAIPHSRQYCDMAKQTLIRSCGLNQNPEPVRTHIPTAAWDFQTDRGDCFARLPGQAYPADSK